MTKIIERGMIFNSEMVRAILDGRKTQTRRIIKDCTVGRDPISKFIQIGKKFIGCYPEDVPELIRECCPYGVPGDRIWVRETWWQAGQSHARYPDDDEYGWYGSRRILFAADGNPPNEPNDHYPNGLGGGKFSAAKPNHLWRKRPSIHMPRWASRILLEITYVRVEQLNDISEEDARSEGISGSSARDVKEAYAALWQSIYGSDSWRANPWVWVIKFKRIEGDGHATD